MHTPGLCTGLGDSPVGIIDPLSKRVAVEKVSGIVPGRGHFGENDEIGASFVGILSFSDDEIGVFLDITNIGVHLANRDLHGDFPFFEQTEEGRMTSPLLQVVDVTVRLEN
jgi:hypothetical protein